MTNLTDQIDQVLQRHGEKWTEQDRAVLRQAAVAVLGVASSPNSHSHQAFITSILASIAAAEAHVVHGILREVVMGAVGFVLDRVGLPEAS